MKTKEPKTKVKIAKPEANGEVKDGPPPPFSVELPGKEKLADAAFYSRAQITSLVDFYYHLQDSRKRVSNKEWALSEGLDTAVGPIPIGDVRNGDNRSADEPELVKMLRKQLERLEAQLAVAMTNYAKAQQLGRWCMSHPGISGVLTAGLLSHIDLTRAQTAGAIWRFAGLEPSMVWEKGCKRPWNARLKVLCWKIGTSIKCVHKRNPDALYCKLYAQRKAQEVQKNNEGAFAEQAEARLEKCKRNGARITDLQKQTWRKGRLQDVGLDTRAMRYAVKIFLSHYHTVGREILGLPVVKPWVLEHGGHVHYIPVPNWPMS